MSQEECAERIRLIEVYGQTVFQLTSLMELLKVPPRGTAALLNGTQAARERSAQAWKILEAHLYEHRCLDLHWSERQTDAVLQTAATAALDVILVVDDDRRYIDLNEAAAAVMGLHWEEIVGRQVDEFFSDAGGQSVPVAWDRFIAEGVQAGICELIGTGRIRRFDYRARANFAPGLHLSVLRELV